VVSPFECDLYQNAPKEGLFFDELFDVYQTGRKSVRAKISCVYTITCSANKKVYVGSAVDFKTRKQIHLAHLRSNRHGNVLLQRAFNLYGEATFQFHPLVITDRDSLLAEEQFWIDRLNACNRQCGFNLAPAVVGTRVTALTAETLARRDAERSKRRKIIKAVFRPRRFKREKPYLSVQNLLPKSRSNKNYAFVSPDGARITVPGGKLKKWCQETFPTLKSAYGAILQMLYGQRNNFNGWCVPGRVVEDNRGRIFRLSAPNGDKIKGKNLSKWLRQMFPIGNQALLNSGFNKLLNGRTDEYLGWRRLDDVTGEEVVALQQNRAA